MEKIMALTMPHIKSTVRCSRLSKTVMFSSVAVWEKGRIRVCSPLVSNRL